MNLDLSYSSLSGLPLLSLSLGLSLFPHPSAVSVYCPFRSLGCLLSSHCFILLSSLYSVSVSLSFTLSSGFNNNLFDIPYIFLYLPSSSWNATVPYHGVI